MSDTNTAKYSDSALALLKANLGYYGSQLDPAVEEYLKKLLNYAYEDLADKGIALTTGEIKDDMQQVMHAAWMYRKGVNGEDKTPMLKAAIRNRQVSDALAADEEGSA